MDAVERQLAQAVAEATRRPFETTVSYSDADRVALAGEAAKLRALADRLEQAGWRKEPGNVE